MGPLDEKLTSVRFLRAESSALGSGPVSNHFRTIPVLDGNGDQLTLYELNGRSWLFGLIVRKRYVLCTGEPVERRGSHFIVAHTGEKLIPVRSPGDSV